jgi:ribonucleoside-diphosphate reductase alpha chain
LFVKLGKQGSTLAGVMDSFAIAVSVGLQYGVPLETFVEKFTNLRFEPAGMTDDPDVRMAQSIMDYVFRRLALDYLDFETRSFMGIHTADERARHLETGSYAAPEPPTRRRGRAREPRRSRWSRHSPVAPEKSDHGWCWRTGGSSARLRWSHGCGRASPVDTPDEVISGAGAASAREVGVRSTRRRTCWPSSRARPPTLRCA